MFNAEDMIIREVSFVLKLIFVLYLARRVFVEIKLISFLILIIS